MTPNLMSLAAVYGDRDKRAFDSASQIHVRRRDQEADYLATENNKVATS